MVTCHFFVPQWYIVERQDHSPEIVLHRCASSWDSQYHSIIQHTWREIDCSKEIISKLEIIGKRRKSLEYLRPCISFVWKLIQKIRDSFYQSWEVRTNSASKIITACTIIWKSGIKVFRIYPEFRIFWTPPNPWFFYFYAVFHQKTLIFPDFLLKLAL